MKYPSFGRHQTGGLGSGGFMDCLVATSIVTLPHSMPTCSLRELMSPREQKPAENSATNFASSMFFEPDRPNLGKPEPTLSVLGALSLT